MALPPTVVSVALNDPTCLGVEDGSIVITANGTGTVEYSIDNGVTFQTSNIFIGLSAGTYDIVVQDITGTISQQVDLTYQKTVIAAFVPSVTSGAAVLDVDFLNTSIGAVDYSWNLDGGSMNSTLVNPSFSYDTPGNFTVTLIASDEDCVDTASAVIAVSGVSAIFDIPNVFTPNGDGINDIFSIPSIGIDVMEVFIFNRYGQIVYEWYGRNGFWDGHTYPAGQPVPDGSYYYQVTATGFDNVEYFLNGQLTVLGNKKEEE